MARQLIVQPHFLHLTTQATGSPKFRPVIRAIIGEQTTKVIPSIKWVPHGREDAVGQPKAINSLQENP